MLNLKFCIQIHILNLSVPVIGEPEVTLPRLTKEHSPKINAPLRKPLQNFIVKKVVLNSGQVGPPKYHYQFPICGAQRIL